MQDVKLNLNDKNQGAFSISIGDEQLAEMVIAIVDQELIVYHTEVAKAAEGQGLAKLLLHTMVNYARANNLKVVPLCPYVHAQFNRHPEEFEDVWQK